MTGRRTSAVVIVAIIAGVALWFFVLRRPEKAPGALPVVGIAAPRPSAMVDMPAPRQEPPPLEGESRLADQLNAPAGDIRADLKILNELFETFQSNFPHTGNPVGENAEITAALSGNNTLRFAFLPRGHRAINSRGELCDRWGTPFRFHQISGQQMEIRSAGPDRKFLTEDDAFWPPR